MTSEDIQTCVKAAREELDMEHHLVTSCVHVAVNSLDLEITVRDLCGMNDQLANYENLFDKTPLANEWTDAVQLIGNAVAALTVMHEALTEKHTEKEEQND